MARRRSGPPAPEERPEPEVIDWEDMTEEELDALEIYGRDDFCFADLDGRELEVTMESFRAVLMPGFNPEDMPQVKVEITFAELDKPLVPGKQVISPIIRAFGRNIAGWKGKRVVLYPDTWTNGGRSGNRVGMRPAGDKPKRRRGRK